MNTIYKRLSAGSLLFAGALVFPLPKGASVALYAAAYLLCGADVLAATVKNIFGKKSGHCACDGHGHEHTHAPRRWNIFDENFLMTVATLGAFAIGEYPEGVAVMLFYQVGEIFQHRALEKSRRSISGLMKLRPEFARVLRGGEEKNVPPEEVLPGETVVIRPGDKIPLDGMIIKGSSSLDTSALTGESLPREVCVGAEILAGSVNLGGVLEMRATQTYRESAAAKILELVQHASSKKTRTENFIRRFARWYTPAVVLGALLVAVLPPILMADASFKTWIYRALVFLVLSCPCALVVSVPLGFFGGLGGAAKQGVLVKGSNYLEALADLHTLIFDKTGTLTKGSFEVTAVKTAGRPEKEILALAAAAERFSNHPLAKAICNAAGDTPGFTAEHVQETAGKGVRGVINGKTVLAGTRLFLAENGVQTPDTEETSTTAVYIAEGGVYAGAVYLADSLKEDAQEAVWTLKNGFVKRLVILSGDTEENVQAVARRLFISEAYGGLLPADKLARLERLLQEKPAGSSVGFVGDGINDSPVLARADVGIAMGALGSDAAIEAADVVLMTDEPSKVAAAVQIARKTRTVVKQNILFALGVKTAVLALGLCGLATMWQAVFADVGVTVLAVLNSLRPLYFKPR